MGIPEGALLATIAIRYPRPAHTVDFLDFVARIKAGMRHVPRLLGSEL